MLFSSSLGTKPCKKVIQVYSLVFLVEHQLKKKFKFFFFFFFQVFLIKKTGKKVIQFYHFQVVLAQNQVMK